MYKKKNRAFVYACKFWNLVILGATWFEGKQKVKNKKYTENKNILKKLKIKNIADFPSGFSFALLFFTPALSLQSSRTETHTRSHTELKPLHIVIRCDP